MLAKSKAQQRLMALTLHNPSKVRKENRGVLKMGKKSLGEFASTKVKGLPEKKKGSNNYLLKVSSFPFEEAGLAKKKKRGKAAEYDVKSMNL